MRAWHNRTAICVAICVVSWSAARCVVADVQFILTNGLVLKGQPGPRLASIAQNALADGELNTDVQPIAFLDDGLRRTFVWKQHIARLIPDDGIVPETIRLEQRVSRSGQRVTGVRDVLHVTDFDDYGRRTITLATPRGPEYIVQGITEISPTYTRVEGLIGKTSHIWDMRIATSSLPRSTLFDILRRQYAEGSEEGYLSTVRLMLASRRFKDAGVELDRALKQFPDLEDRLGGLRRQLQNQLAEQLLEEIQLRRSAGRIVQTRDMLERFPVTDGVAGEVLVQVRELLEEDKRQMEQVQRVLTSVAAQVTTLDDAELKPVAEAFQRELERDLSPNSLPRMAAYLNLMSDDSLQPTQKLALALGGWLLGPSGDNTTLTRIASLWEARQLVAKYLRSRGEAEADQRADWLERLRQLEGTSPQNVALLLATMNPPESLPDTQENIPGLYRVEAGDAQGLGRFTYYVQLPPEYDPQRRYPVIVTLHRAGSSPLQQIHWWCGPYSEAHSERLGQATRHGYIVVAPQWTQPAQLRYEYTAHEHYAVLVSLRDAMQRFAVDTDRVFLSGHSSGGDAAWDIGLAHPDLWAGVLPIVATAEYTTSDAPKYVANYWSNAKYVPMYFVCGELDGDLTIRNARMWDKYLKGGFDVLVTEYRGRGHEMFGDEIQRIFAWLNLQRRDFYPKEFEVQAMRPWDNFFWCVEVEGYKPKTLVYPLEWDQAKAGNKAVTRVTCTDSSILVRTAGERVTLLLSPKLVNLNQPLRITVDGRPYRDPIEPSIATMLEDVRTRGDRLNPFWVKIPN